MSIYDINSDEGRRMRTRMRRLENSAPYTRRSALVTSDSDFASVSRSALDSDLSISLTNDGIPKLGSLPPSIIAGNFAYVPTENSITWYWDATNGSNLLVIRRADNTNFTIPTGTLTVSGLTPNAQYYFYPFWSVTGARCSNVSWVIGDIGSPQFAFTTISTDALRQQTLQFREALSGGAMTASTTVAGTGTGTSAPAGGGGADGDCVITGTLIVPVNGKGNLTLSRHPESVWTQITTVKGKSLTATRNHRVYTENKLEEMRNLDKGMRVITVDGLETLESVQHFQKTSVKVKFHCEPGNLAWTDGILSHNIKTRDGGIE